MTEPMHHVPGEDQPGGGAAFGKALRAKTGKPVSKLDRRHYWMAVAALREAEELTRLTSQVSGPADAPPDAATTASFVDDWVARGKRALQRAVDIASGGSVKAAKDIARKAVSRLREGARSLLSTAQGAASEGLKTFAAAATWAGIAMTGGIIALSILAAVVAWKLSQSKSKR